MGNQDNGSEALPEDVVNVLKSSPIGYLSVSSKKGELFSYPVAFYFSGLKVYFMTPISAAKLRFIRANPTVSFLVDNHLLTKGACGAMIQGKARVFSIAKTVVNILSVGPKMAHFARKYPGMFSFYASGKELPDERKLYKYRLVRIDPSKVLYWQGYRFARFAPKEREGEDDALAVEQDPLALTADDEKMDTLAKLLTSADEELQPIPTNENREWLENLELAAKQNEISDEERSVFDSYRSFLRKVAALNVVGPRVSSEERDLLDKWKNRRRKEQ